MKLTDIMPIEAWIEIEKEIHGRAGLNAAVYDVNGQRITDFKGFANQLCPVLRETGNGQKFICAVVHQNMASRADRTGKSIVAECDAGLMKFVVPIIYDDEFLGTAGGCGLLREKQQVDTYLVHRTTGLAEDRVQQLAADVDTITPERLENVLGLVETRVTEALERINGDKIGATAGWIYHDYQYCQHMTREIENFAQKRHSPCLGRIPFDPVFTEAMIQAQTVIEYGNGSRVNTAIKAIWRRIEDRLDLL